MTYDEAIEEFPSLEFMTNAQLASLFVHAGEVTNSDHKSLREAVEAVLKQREEESARDEN